MIFHDDSEKELFEIPDGEIHQFEVKKFRCLACGQEEDRVFLTLIATKYYAPHNGVLKRKWMYAQRPSCGCLDCIWIENGPAPKNYN